MLLLCESMWPEEESVATVLERPVTCKCGEVFTTLEAAKVHYFLVVSFPTIVPHEKKK